MIGNSSLRSKGVQLSEQVVIEAQKKLKAIKYPVRAISNAVFLKKKLGQLKEEPRKKLEKAIDRKINSFRQVRGDGNCFFRALAFSIISNKKTTKFEDIFEDFDDISLDFCKKETIPKEFKEFYRNDLLKVIMREYWQKEINFFAKITTNIYNFRNFRRALARMITENPYMDFLIILYFRAVCLIAFKKMKSDVKDFLKGTEEQEISTYGEQSEGVILNLMSKFFKLDIFIYQIRKDEVVTYEYCNEQKSYFFKSDNKNPIYLLFYDNHYDLLQDNENPLAEFDDEKIEEQFYQAASNNYIKGVCIECEKTTDVNEENGLCLTCFNKSMENLNSFQKDKMVQGFCNQCNKTKKRVSEQMQICEECLNDIQYASNPNSRIRDPYEHRGGHSDANRQMSGNYIQCGRCHLKKHHSQLDEFYICFSCKTEEIDKRQKLKNQGMPSKIGLSKIDSHSSEYTTLQNKLESQIGRDNRLKQEEMERIKKDKNGPMQAKIYPLSKPLFYTCNKCKQLFESYSDLLQDEKVCKNCDINPSASKMQGKSAVKKEKDLHHYVCEGCKQQFSSQTEILKYSEKYCTNCHKKPSGKIVAQSVITEKPKCLKCKNAQSQFYKLSNGLCSKCSKGAQSSIYRK